MASKVILAIEHSLRNKYGQNFRLIKEALEAIASVNPSVPGEVIFIDNQETMRGLGLQPLGVPVKTGDFGDQRRVKKTVDEVFLAKKKPDYLIIFGARDVFPFQDLLNPCLAGSSLDDQVVASDLPYACEAGYGRDIKNFMHPSRVVGRIPDVPGSNDVAYVQRLADNIKNHKIGTPADYRNYFALTAEHWKTSTTISLTNVFGNAANLLSVPPQPAQYTNSQLKVLSHYINCHGAPSHPAYMGQPKDSSARPDALLTQNLDNNVSLGTVVAAECCYGGLLFKPLPDGRQSIPGNYFKNGAVAFMGSTTISYGQPDKTECADFICSRYMEYVLKGNSFGRALLQARIDYVAKTFPLTEPSAPLKTIGQFYLLGDPSLQAVPTLESDVAIESRREQFRFDAKAKKMVTLDPVVLHRKVKSPQPDQLKKVLNEYGYPSQSEIVYGYETGRESFIFADTGFGKDLRENPIIYRVFTKGEHNPSGIKGLVDINILLIKEDTKQILELRHLQSK